MEENQIWSGQWHPPYLPDLTLSDVHLFPPMKGNRSSKRHGGDDEMKKSKELAS